MTGDRDAASHGDGDVIVTYDPALAGRRVEADGGGWVEGAGAGYRATFTGTLTGRRLAQGDPPWVWVELGELTEAPDDFEDAYVWVEQSYVYFLDQR